MNFNIFGVICLIGNNSRLVLDVGDISPCCVEFILQYKLSLSQVSMIYAGMSVGYIIFNPLAAWMTNKVWEKIQSLQIHVGTEWWASYVCTYYLCHAPTCVDVTQNQRSIIALIIHFPAISIWSSQVCPSLFSSPWFMQQFTQKLVSTLWIEMFWLSESFFFFRGLYTDRW